jgi:hypothetical protein
MRAYSLMITKEKFEDAYRKHMPSTVESIYLKYVSLISIHENRFFTAFFGVFLILPFILSLISNFHIIPAVFNTIADITYISLLTILGILFLIIWYKRYKRFEKIRKYLGISRKEYINIVNEYYYTKRYKKINIKDDIFRKIK